MQMRVCNQQLICSIFKQFIYDHCLLCVSRLDLNISAPSQPKLKVKPGLHLLDPLAVQRRFLSVAGAGICDDSPEVGSTTNSLDDMMMSNSAMLK